MSASRQNLVVLLTAAALVAGLYTAAHVLVLPPPPGPQVEGVAPPASEL